jgi:hypothetical protein
MMAFETDNVATATSVSSRARTPVGLSWLGLSRVRADTSLVRRVRVALLSRNALLVPGAGLCRRGDARSPYGQPSHDHDNGH